MKKIPQRMCVACQEMHNKKELLRIVKTPEGEYLLDDTGKKSGRGAYVCHKEECLNKAFKEKRLEKSFKNPVDNEIYQQLKARIFGDD